MLCCVFGLMLLGGISSMRDHRGDTERILGVRIFDTRITNPDLASPQNLEFDEYNGMIDEVARVLNPSERCKIGYLYRDRYYVVEFDPKTIKSEPELKQYFKDSKKASTRVGVWSEYSVNFVEDGRVLSPFTDTSILPTKEPTTAEYIHEVQ